MPSILNATTTNGLVTSADNSGSLQLQTNNGTTAVTIDTSQNVGVGTTSPNLYSLSFGRILTVSTSNASGYASITTAGGSGGGGIIDFGNQTIRHAAISSVDGSALVFNTNATNSGNTLTERMRITSGGDVAITQAAGKYTIDITGGATTIANGGTVDFPLASGMLVVNNWTNGGVTIYLCGGGNTSVVASVTAQAGSFAYNAGVNGYRWTSGQTASYGFFFVRTRTGA